MYRATDTKLCKNSLHSQHFSKCSASFADRKSASWIKIHARSIRMWFPIHNLVRTFRTDLLSKAAACDRWLGFFLDWVGRLQPNHVQVASILADSRQWSDACPKVFMSTTEMVEQLLQQATALAKAGRNLEIMDRTAILHGYLELSKLDSTNQTYRKDIDDAVARLLATVECGNSA